MQLGACTWPCAWSRPCAWARGVIAARGGSGCVGGGGEAWAEGSCRRHRVRGIVSGHGPAVARVAKVPSESQGNCLVKSSGSQRNNLPASVKFRVPSESFPSLKSRQNMSDLLGAAHGAASRLCLVSSRLCLVSSRLCLVSSRLCLVSSRLCQHKAQPPPPAPKIGGVCDGQQARKHKGTAGC